ncbi:hypothetical protein CY35_11G034000 [Sphagnum magellanicum]|nr:hypothetical protein CY35_11G034000 [Sphagnum magellanicum]
MVSSDASDKLQSCENLASSGGSQATQAQDAQPCTRAEPEATGVSVHQQRNSSPSLCSSTPLATSEDCISSSARGCDYSQDDESSHDQITHSLEHERASSCSLYPQSCCSSAMGRAGSTSVVDVRNTAPTSRTGQSQDVFFPHRQEEGLGRRDEGTSWQMQALEFQAIGACRTDERLKPLLRWNVSCCGADGRLLAHLGQHFKARELAMLARCLCAPLVSIRVGKVSRQGHLLCPTTTRGYLSLRMLLSSDMQLTFVTDAGITERIPVLSSGLETSGVILEHLAADLSGRSFVLKSPGHKLSFFWQSEISKAVGDEMVCKMKDLLKRQPSLSQLTGIHETRLDTFASYLRSALVATSESTSATGQLPVTVAAPVSSSKTTGLSQVLLPPALTSNPPVYYQPPAHFNSFKTLLPQFVGTQLPAIATSSSWTQKIPALTSNGLEVCCSTRGSSTSSPQFLEPAREIQHLCTNLPSWSGVSSLSSPLSSDSQRLVSRNALGGTVNALWSTRTSFFQEKTQVHSTGLSLPLQPTIPSSQHEDLEWHPERTMTMTHSLLGLPFPSLPETLYPFPSMVGVPASSSFLPPPLTQVPISTSLFSPYYCPCPLGTTTLQYTNAPPFLPAKIGDVGFVPTASPFFTVRPPPALVPSSALGMHGIHMYLKIRPP